MLLKPVTTRKTHGGTFMEAFQITFDFSTSLPIVVEPSVAQLSSDAGLLPIRQLDEKLGRTEQFAGALVD